MSLHFGLLSPLLPKPVPMSVLKLGIEGLESADVSRVRILLRLLTGNPQFAWVYAAEGPFDALLAGDGETQTRCAVVIDVLPAGSTAYAGAICRPIEADALEALLLTLQNQLQPTVFGELLPGSDDIFGSFEATHAAPLAPTPAPVQMLVTPAVTSTVVASSTRLTADLMAASGTEEYKLKRWPPQAVLRDSRDRIRLANLISRKSLTVEQMVQGSGISRAEVQAFVTVLQSFGIVSVALAATGSSVPRLSTATCAAPRQKQKRSFLSAIRRKLGI